MSRLKDKVAIITGGSQGIGREYALRFAREGAKIVIGDIREAQAQEVVQEIANLGGEGLALGIDVSKEQDTKRLAATTHEHFGRIDILLNNAAIFYDMELKDQSLDYFNKILSVNLTGVWLCSRAVEPYMKRQRKARSFTNPPPLPTLETRASWTHRIPTCRHRPPITPWRR